MTAITSAPKSILNRFGADLHPLLALPVAVAGSALWIREGRTSVMLPVLLLSIVPAYLIRPGFAGAAGRAALRVLVFISVVVLYRMHPALEQNTFVESYNLDQLAELCFAELVVRMWQRSSGKAAVSAASNTLPVLLIGFVFIVASNTYDETIGKVFALPFILSLIVGIQGYREGATVFIDRRGKLLSAAAFAAAIVLGSILFQGLSLNREALTEWANRMLMEARPINPGGDLDESSRLSSMFGQSGSLDRIMRIRTRADVSYMRASSLYRYSKSAWGPDGRANERTYFPIQSSDLQSDFPGQPALVTRYASTRGTIMAPLNSASVEIDDAAKLRWARADGGAIRAADPMPDSYRIVVGPRDHQGPLAIPPDPDYRHKLLELPPEISPRIRKLAAEITAGKTSQVDKARAIETYLPAHHGYSLSIRVGQQDPLSEFLFSTKAAHCEYFATAAVILMRCAGIPARYTIGFYAHEADGDDLIVRNRDAHAWAECWIDGTGWITVDATPSDGKPQDGGNTIPAWRRAYERLQDLVNYIKSGITPGNIVKSAGALIVLAVAAYLLQFRFNLNWRRKQETRKLQYTDIDVGLKRATARFEKLMLQAGFVCPPSIPWLEFLDKQGGTMTRPMVDIAKDYLADYNSHRFGRQTDSARLGELDRLLDTLEAAAARIAADKEKGV